MSALIPMLCAAVAAWLDIGGEPGGQSPEEFAARIRAETASWQKVAKAAGIKPQ